MTILEKTEAINNLRQLLETYKSNNIDIKPVINKINDLLSHI